MSDEPRFTIAELMQKLSGATIGGANPQAVAPVAPAIATPDPTAATGLSASQIAAAVQQGLAAALTNQVPVGSATPGVTMRGQVAAVSTAVPLERDVSVLEMSTDQVHEMMVKAGGDPWQPYHPRNRAARAEVRKATEAALRTRRVGVNK